MTDLNYELPHVHLDQAEYEIAQRVGWRRAAAETQPRLAGARRAVDPQVYIDAAVAECGVAKFLGTYWTGLGDPCPAHPRGGRAEVFPNVRVRLLGFGDTEIDLHPGEFQIGQIVIATYISPMRTTTIFMLGWLGPLQDHRHLAMHATSLADLMPMAALSHGTATDFEIASAAEADR